MSDNTPQTGRQRLNQQVLAGAGALTNPALAIAQGTKPLQAIKDQIKDMSLERLIGPTAVFAGGMIGVLKTVRSIVRESGILEKGLRNIADMRQIEGKFETLLGSATLAKQRIKELYEFAAKSPFDIKSVAEANRVLEALTHGAFSGAHAMQLIGDAAAATNQPIELVASRFGKLYQALNSGRNFEATLAKMEGMGLVTDELARSLEVLQSQGGNVSAMWGEVEKSLAATTGGMKSEMRTVAGLSTALDNASDKMAQAFGEPFVEAQVKALQNSVDATKNLTPLVAEIGRDWALVPSVISDTKNRIVESTFASKGFASALQGVYEIVTAIGAGIAVSGVATSVRNAVQIVRGVASSSRNLKGGMVSPMAAAKAEGGSIATAKALAAAGGEQLAEGNFGGLLDIVKGKVGQVTAHLRVLHETSTLSARGMKWTADGAQIAGAALGNFSLKTYLANIAVGGLGAGLRGARALLSMFTLGLSDAAIALVSTGWGAALVAIGVLGTMIYRNIMAVREADKAYKELTESLHATTKALSDQAKQIQTLDDWRASVAAITQEIVKLNGELANTPVTRDNLREVQAKKKELKERKALQAAAQNRDTGTLAPSNTESSNIRAHAQDARTAWEAKFQDDLSQASPERQAAMLKAHAAQLASEAEAGRQSEQDSSAFDRSAAGKKSSESQTRAAEIQGTFDAMPGDTMKEKAAAALEALRLAKEGIAKAKDHDRVSGAEGTGNYNAKAAQAELERAQQNVKNLQDFHAIPGLKADARNAVLTGGSDLQRAQQELEDLKASKNSADQAKVAAKIAEVQRLADESKNYASKDQQAQAESRKAAQIARQLELAKISDLYDGRIADAKAAGKDTAKLEYQKQQDLLQKQKEQAEALGDTAEAARIQTKMDANKADRYGPDSDLARGRQGIAANRLRDAALMRGDVKGARTVDDVQGLLDQRRQYKALGLSAESADQDFKNNMLAQAAMKAPRVVTSSLQSIGGGGGFAASDPVAAAQERVRRVAENNGKILEEIRDLLKPDPTQD